MPEIEILVANYWWI